MSAFHEILFPLDIALGSRGGPVRRTDIITTGSGREERNQSWYHSRRKFNAGYGVKSLNDLSQVIAFFEERRGRLYGFRWRDKTDFLSCAHGQTPHFADQLLGQGDGETAQFQLVKIYGSAHAPYVRTIRKPVMTSVRAAVSGVEALPAHFSVDHASGMVTFATGHVPPAGAAVTAGFRFDTPVRFDTDELVIDMAAFEAGEIPDIPVVELIQESN